jgi:hypothetical protein
MRVVTIILLGLIFMAAGAAWTAQSIEKYAGLTVIEPDSPYCFEVGKDSELGGDCFCVEDELTTVEELDCLIKSGVVPENERDSFLIGMGLLKPAVQESAPAESQTEEPTVEPTEPSAESPPGSNIVTRPFCWDIGKTSESEGDCFCVEGQLDTLEELDCLIASGVIPESEYEKYRENILSKN